MEIVNRDANTMDDIYGQPKGWFDEMRARLSEAIRKHMSITAKAVARITSELDFEDKIKQNKDKLKKNDKETMENLAFPVMVELVALGVDYAIKPFKLAPVLQEEIPDVPTEVLYMVLGEKVTLNSVFESMVRWFKEQDRYVGMFEAMIAEEDEWQQTLKREKFLALIKERQDKFQPITMMELIEIVSEQN